MVTISNILSNPYLTPEKKEMLIAFLQRNEKKISEDTISALMRAEGFYRYKLITLDELKSVYREAGIPFDFRYVLLNKGNQKRR